MMCPDSNPQFLNFFDLSIAPPLLFYAYIPIVILSLLFGLYVLFADKYSLKSKLFFFIALFFSLWIGNILIQWIAVYVGAVHFAWEITALLEVPIYVFSVYLLFVSINKKDISFNAKIALSLLFLPIILLLPSTLNINSFDLINCEGVIGYLWNYIYVLEAGIIVWLGLIGVHAYRGSKNSAFRKQTLILTAGMILFLTLFFLTNLTGEITKIYEVNLVGPIGMLIFLGVFSYLIVKFRTINVRLIGTNVLVIALCTLVFSLLFINDFNILRMVIIITFVLLVIVGIMLIEATTRQVKQKEQIEKLAKDLQVANVRLLELDKQKTEFISFATHQLRAPLASMTGYVSMILEGDYGEVSEKIKQSLHVIYESSRTLANVVDGYLNVSRIELGTMSYTFSPLDLGKLAEEVVAELKPNIEKSGLKFEFSADSTKSYLVSADQDKLKQVLTNLIDNSVKYTQEGEVYVKVEKNEQKKTVLFSVKDSGIGMSKETIPKLFEKFVRAQNANKANIHGTGLGLFVAKEIVGAHKGKVWAESEGDGKGSQFYVELPLK